MTVTDDVGHLGMLVGTPRADRIVALSTSAVFRDKSLLRTFMHDASRDIDSGFQAHLYTRPNAIFMARVPDITHATADRVGTSVDVNHEIWASLTGVELVSSRTRIVLVIDHVEDARELPSCMAWHAGSLLDAAASRYLAGGASFLVFVLDETVATKQGIDDRTAPELMRRGKAATFFMDKNRATKWLRANGIDTAPTWTFDHGKPSDEILGSLPGNARYVFKPAGGTAGAAVFPSGERGAGARAIRDHVSDLHRRGCPAAAVPDTGISVGRVARYFGPHRRAGLVSGGRAHRDRDAARPRGRRTGQLRDHRYLATEKISQLDPTRNGA